jgi:hypothetical protein
MNNKYSKSHSILSNKRINFIHKDLHRWHDLKHRLNSRSINDIISKDGKDGRDSWIIQAYCRLKEKGFNVKLSHCYIPDELCIAHYDDVVFEKDAWKSFVVSIRADRERTFICDLELVQSPASKEHANAFFINNWPQPGLIPRSSNRGNKLKRLGFFGPAKNLGAQYRSDYFVKELGKLGVELVIRENREEWADYSDIDAVLAVRDGSTNFLASKPASKLINAWIAGVPAFVGDEPAYEYHRRSEYDFIRISSSEEAIGQLKRLKDSPSLYATYRKQAQVRGKEYGPEKIINEWIELLNTEILPRYHNWLHKNFPARTIFDVSKHQWRKLRRKLRGYKYTRGYDFYGNPIYKRYTLRRRIAWKIDNLLTSLESHK